MPEQNDKYLISLLFCRDRQSPPAEANCFFYSEQPLAEGTVITLIELDSNDLTLRSVEAAWIRDFPNWVVVQRRERVHRGRRLTDGISYRVVPADPDVLALFELPRGASFELEGEETP